MAKLDIEWLSIFIEVYQCNSVSVAAERLNIAQASASIGLSKLRAYFNDRLFTRTSDGMQPTPYAKELYPVISDTLDALSRARHAVGFRPATVERNFRISMTDISETVILPVLLNHLHKVAPGVSIQAEAITSESARRLEDGGVDLAIGFMPHLEAGFLQRTLFSETFVCLASRDHPRIGDHLTRSAFLSERHILVSTSGTGHFIVDKVLSKHGLQRKVSLRLPSFLGVARIVASTDMLVIVPRRVGESFANQEAVKLLDPPVSIPSYSVKLHWHERFHADTGNAWLRQALADLFAPLKAAGAPA